MHTLPMAFLTCCGCVRHVCSIAKKPETLKRLAELRAEFAGKRVLLGVDRLDYIKVRHAFCACPAASTSPGVLMVVPSPPVLCVPCCQGLPHKLLAMEGLLQHYGRWRGDVVFIQIGVPTRSKVHLYQRLSRKVRTSPLLAPGRRRLAIDW